MRRTVRIGVTGLCLGALVCSARPALAQVPDPPLAEIARLELERRAALQVHARVITESDLKRNLPLTTAAARPEAEAPTESGVPVAASTPVPAATAVPAVPAAAQIAEPPAPVAGSLDEPATLAPTAPAAEPAPRRSEAATAPRVARAPTKVASPPAPPQPSQAQLTAERLDAARDQLARARAAFESAQARVTALTADWVGAPDEASRTSIAAARDALAAEAERMRADIDAQSKAIAQLERDLVKQVRSPARPK